MDRIPPKNKHDAVLWLLDVLESQREDPLQVEVVIGLLPGDYGFEEVVEALDEIDGRFFVDSNKAARSISFVPHDAFVYRSLADMLERRRSSLYQVPGKFTILEPHYEHGVSDDVPPQIKNYLSAVKLWRVLEGISSYKSDGHNLNFIVGHGQVVCVTPRYATSDLIEIPSLQGFVEGVAESDLHKQEKIAIIKSGLVEKFGGGVCVEFSSLIERFEALMIYFRESYALYLAEFSTAKFRREVEKQNLDDTLRLNKTLSEIQNQLLAVPAALLVAGATVDPKSASKNLAIIFGMMVFSLFMFILVGNQRNSVSAIGSEVALRKGLLDTQPNGIASQYEDSFGALSARVEMQLKVLSMIRCLVMVVLAFTALIAVNALFDGIIFSMIEGGAFFAKDWLGDLLAIVYGRLSDVGI